MVYDFLLVFESEVYHGWPRSMVGLIDDSPEKLYVAFFVNFGDFLFKSTR